MIWILKKEREGQYEIYQTKRGDFGNHMGGRMDERDAAPAGSGRSLRIVFDADSFLYRRASGRAGGGGREFSPGYNAGFVCPGGGGAYGKL